MGLLVFYLGLKVPKTESNPNKDDIDKLAKEVLKFEFSVLRS